ncbi:pyocin activator PrtN family protein [Pseudomonas lundensis]|uniref:pyocin activator PrtN family protein n=1 Tax=Serratia proteamaculans TaxID=28151 RepID=UPI0029810C8B|nr:pyocin activator PrtN family protein [Serratia proteamaculans]MDW5502935.1 pyocin activator PrtN family protein [Serratia proteamaculans]MDW5507990.1 pyocin activator PrtN family protein [Pseudomonas lundensis]
MNTMFLLMAKFNDANIPLADIAEQYMGMSAQMADRKATEGSLPIHTYRIGVSQKAPRMIHVKDLADYIDKQRKEAKEEWDYLQTNLKQKQ